MVVNEVCYDAHCQELYPTGLRSASLKTPIHLDALEKKSLRKRRVNIEREVAEYAKLKTYEDREKVGLVLTKLRG